MLPYIDLLGKQIPTYSLLGVLGVLIGGVAVCRFCVLVFGKYRDDALNMYIYALLFALAGAKLLYIFTMLPSALQNVSLLAEYPMEYFSYFFGGMVFYGGLIGAAVGALFYSWQFGILFSEYAPVLIVSVPVIHCFGRIGCYAAGCCYGLPCPPPWGVCFSSVKPGEYLLPVQLIESLFNALLFILLIVCALKIKRKLKILGIYFIGYSVFRFILEFFRYDEIRGFLFGLSTSQFISIFIFAAGMAFLIRDDYLSDKLDKIAGMRARKKARKKDRTIAPS